VSRGRWGSGMQALPWVLKLRLHALEVLRSQTGEHAQRTVMQACTRLPFTSTICVRLRSASSGRPGVATASL
jgi:hypothetical protein